MGEIWKRVPNYEDYEISNLGRLMSYKCNKTTLIKGSQAPNGYLQYNLINKNGAFKRSASVIVAMAFLGHKPKGYHIVIDHINNIKTDNRLENIRIVTQRFNAFRVQGAYTSKYKGVAWHKANKKWVASMSMGKVKKYLGSFTDEYQAHLAYQKAIKEL